ncbi:Lanosterol 14-alpha demethylase [Lamellibrachia satsuma]|nr:Lanosterol 14-alpha demethylase [Lamellibrachia satsuma]
MFLTTKICITLEGGKEIRSMLDESVAKLYWDLDGGFSSMAWLLPGWLPLPSFRRRDEAHKKLKQQFYTAIQKRRTSGDVEEDMLQTLLDSTYKSGRHLNDDEIAGMLIGLLLAGQHTSSTTSAWMLFFLAKNKDLQDQCYEEQMNVFGNDGSVDYDGIKQCELLDRCMKESLRLRPPIFTMMRLSMSPQKVLGYTIPPGQQVCVSPPTNMRLPEVWERNLVYDPDRFLDMTGVASDEKFSYVPFGAGRHRCIGESFAYVQVKTIMSTLLQLYEFHLIDGRFPNIDKTTMIQTPENPIIGYTRRQPTTH